MIEKSDNVYFCIWMISGFFILVAKFILFVHLSTIKLPFFRNSKRKIINLTLNFLQHYNLPRSWIIFFSPSYFVLIFSRPLLKYLFNGTYAQKNKKTAIGQWLVIFLTRRWCFTLDGEGWTNTKVTNFERNDVTVGS